MTRRGFTLVELMVSVVVLLVIIAATARIFSATSRVSSLGEANAEMQGIATAIEHTIRRDIHRISMDNFLAIQCVAVRNDVNQQLYPAAFVTPPLLDSTRDAKDFIRADQIVFIADGQEPTKAFEDSGFGNRASGPEARYFTVRTGALGADITLISEASSWQQLIRIGHGMQFPQMQTEQTLLHLMQDAALMSYNAGTSRSPEGPPMPWMRQLPGLPKLQFAYFDNETPPAAGKELVLGIQPEARRWSLARQATLLADDGGNPLAKGPLMYRANVASGMKVNSATSIFQKGYDLPVKTSNYLDLVNGIFIADKDIFPDRSISSGRVDIAATNARQLRSFFEMAKSSTSPTGSFLPWTKDSVVGVQTPDGSVRRRLLNACFGAYLYFDPDRASVPTDPEWTTEGMWGWPRAERTPPSMDRADLMTAASTIAGNVSSFQIEWTWREGTGRQMTEDGTPQSADLPPDANNDYSIYSIPLPGVMLSTWPLIERIKSDSQAVARLHSIPISNLVTSQVPWFGLPDSLFPPAQRSGTTMLSGGLLESVGMPISRARNVELMNSCAVPIQILDPRKAGTLAAGKAVPTDLITVAVAAPPLDVSRIEGSRASGAISRPLGLNSKGLPIPVYVYQATFGYNGTTAFDTDDHVADYQLNSGTAIPLSHSVLRSDYTPWPTSLRFTFTLHDPKMSIESGRIYQFIVNLSEPAK